MIAPAWIPTHLTSLNYNVSPLTRPYLQFNLGDPDSAKEVSPDALSHNYFAGTFCSTLARVVGNHLSGKRPNPEGS
jgi:hypothetical protein